MITDDVSGSTDAPVALVTGSSRGIGAATARMMAASGYSVCINHRSSETDAEQVAADIRAAGGRAIVCRADVGDEGDVQRLFATCCAALGVPTVLVNNAGSLGRFARLDETDRDRWERSFRTNVLGPSSCCREAVRLMSRARGGAGGAIVNVSSTAVRTGSPDRHIEYAAAKAALEVLSIGLSREVAGEGIRVNAVRVGLVDTAIHALTGQAEQLEEIARQRPMGRVAEPHEIAAAIMWLCSDEASYVTGAILDVTGGG